MNADDVYTITRSAEILTAITDVLKAKPRKENQQDLSTHDNLVQQLDAARDTLAAVAGLSPDDVSQPDYVNEWRHQLEQALFGS